MKRQEFINLFIEALEIEDTVVTEKTMLNSLNEWDSMGVMIIIGLVSDNFDKALKSEDMKGLTSIESLMEKIGLEKFGD